MTTIIKTSGFTGSTAGLKLLSDYELFPLANLLALYEFGAGAGAVLTDTSGNGNNGAITQGAGAWVAEGTGFSYQFDGAATKIALPFGSGAIAQPVSLAVVYKGDSTGPNAIGQVIGNVSDTGHGFGIGYDKQANAGAGGTDAYYGQTNNALGASVIADAANNTWGLAVASTDGAGNLVVANLTKGVQTSFAAGLYQGSAGNFAMGQNPGGAGLGAVTWFKGRIAAAAVWKRVVNPLASATNPTGPSEFQKIRTFMQGVVAGRGIAI